MNTKHTSGPWRMSDHGDKRHREFAIMCDKGGKDGDGGKVASVYAGFGHHFTFEEAEAHARLIAAAPELLAALKTLCDPNWARVDPDGFAILQERARAAIAKAEGKA